MAGDLIWPADHEPPPLDGERGAVDHPLIGEIFETIARFRSLGATLGSIAESVCERLGFHSCAILLARPETDLLVIEGAARLAPSYVEAVNRSHPIHTADPRLSEGPSSQAFLTGRPVIVADTETTRAFRRWRALARGQQIRSLVALPLRARGEIIGTLNCYQREPRRYVAAEIRALTAVAAQVGIAVEIARMVEAQAQAIARLGELTATLEEQRRLLEQSEAIHDALTQLVLTNQGIPAIARTLARLVARPVVVQDQFLHPVAMAGATGEPAEGLFCLTARALGAWPPDTSPSPRDARAPFQLPRLDQYEFDQPCAVAPIVAGRELLGHVSVLLPELPAPPLTLRALEHAATVLALEMVKERLAHEVELRVRRGFGDDLIAGRFDDPERMRDRGRYLGYDLRGPFQALVFDLDQFGRYVAERRLAEGEIDALRRRFFDVLQGVARMYAPHALVTGRHDRLAIVLAAVDGPRAGVAEQVMTNVRQAARRALPDLSVSAGIGRVYHRLDEIRRSFDEGCRVIQVIRRFGGRGKTTRYAELGVARLLFQVEEPAELIDFAHTRLAPVLAYDRRHGGILLAALEAYLAADQSVAEAAARLQLHPNTLRYRLRKIEDLLDASLASTALLLDLQLACSILRLLDAPPSGAPAV